MQGLRTKLKHTPNLSVSETKLKEPQTESPKALNLETLIPKPYTSN